MYNTTIVIRKGYSKRRRPRRQYITANYRIRVPELRVLSEKGEMIGVMPTKQALMKAQAEEKDLVLVTQKAQPPIAKIIEISKYKYQLKQKEAKSRKNSKTSSLKELRFSIFMGEADFESRLKKVHQFLEKGHKVRLTLHFRGRQITLKETAYDLFNKIFEATAETAEIEIQPKIIGKKLMAQLKPVKKK